MVKTGILYSVDIKNRIISLKESKRIIFFFLSKGLLKKYKNYLYKGNLVSFVCDDNKLIKHEHLGYEVKYFKEISVPGRYGKDILYSKRDIKLELKKFINNLNNLLFIDIEMTMPEYGMSGNFSSEMIQTGFFITDKDLNIIEEYNYYIKPTVSKFISKRTKDFLNIDYEFLLDNGISYDVFYNKYKELLDKYKPAVIVFGKNDKSFLEKSFKTNNVKSLNNETRFVNLNQLVKTFYELSSDPGLVKIYENMYGISKIVQKHNALEDAYYTYYVYKKFKDDVNM